MFITKKSLPRRTFLRGAGAALGLPLLDAMVPSLSATAQTAARPVRRMGFVYLPNGVARNFSGINYWTPKGEGTNFEFSPILTPLAKYRDRMVVVSGLAQHQADAFDDGANGDHTRGTSSWLTGVHPKRTEGADLRNGISADQIAAAQLGKDTALPSLELCIDLNFLGGQCENSYSCAYMNTLSWRTANSPLPTENNPRIVFERLFGDGGTSVQRLAQTRENSSILDSVMQDLARLQRTLGPGDRTKVSDYVDAVREVERRIQSLSAIGKRGAQSELPTLERPAGIPDRFDEHVKLMYELQWLAFRADITRVVTFMLGRELNFRTYPEIGISEGHHGLSHHQNSAAQLAKYAKLNTYQTELFAWFVDKLQTTPEGDGTLLDHSIFLYGASLSNPNLHAHYDLPLAVVGGLKGGRHMVFKGEPPMTNLLLGMLDTVGVQVDTLGDSTGRIQL